MLFVDVDYDGKIFDMDRTIFGSSLEDDSVARDIDLAVEGILPEMFFKFYARLFMSLPTLVV